MEKVKTSNLIFPVILEEGNHVRSFKAFQIQLFSMHSIHSSGIKFRRNKEETNEST